MAQAATTVAAPAATTTTAVTMPPPATEFITCPECGTTASVTLNRRDSVDFCRNCDYPLFWTPSKIIRDPADSSDESLRRLPGTVGRATIASLACPFCYEPNALSAQTCVRCGKPMHPVVQDGAATGLRPTTRHRSCPRRRPRSAGGSGRCWPSLPQR